MKKSSNFAIAMFLLFSITGCDQSPNAPATPTTPLAQVGSMPLAQLPGGIDLPRFSEWIPDPAGVKVTTENGGFVIDGNDSQFGYQIESPPISVKPRSNLIVRVDYISKSGSICLGILTGDRKSWIANAPSGATDLHFNSGINKEVIVMIANCNERPHGNPKSKFQLKSAMIASADK